MVASSNGKKSPARPVDSRGMAKWSLRLQTLGDMHDAAVLEESRSKARAQAQAQARAWLQAKEDRAAEAAAAAKAAAAAAKECADLEDAQMLLWRRHDDARAVRAQLFSQGTGTGYPQQQASPSTAFVPISATAAPNLQYDDGIRRDANSFWDFLIGCLKDNPDKSFLFQVYPEFEECRWDYSRLYPFIRKMEGVVGRKVQWDDDDL